MACKVNLVLDDEVKAELDRLVPAGQRSRFANEALSAHLLARRRRRAMAALDRLRARMSPVSTEEIVRLLREDRSRR